MGSIFASRETKNVQVGDPVINVKIAKLSAKSLDKAEEQRQIAASLKAKALPEAVFRGIAEAQEKKESRRDEQGNPLPDAPKKEPTLEEKQKARYESYDRHSVLVAGVKSWDADLPVNNDSLSDLEYEAADALYKAIIDFSLGPIDPKVREVEESKG